jgi:hypothetical protein
MAEQTIKRSSRRRATYNKADLVPASIDVGNGTTKAKATAGGPVISFPSTYSVQHQALEGWEAAGLDLADDFVIEMSGTAFAIGDTVLDRGLIPVQIRHQSRIKTEYYQILFAAALSQLFKRDAVIRAVVSLPPMMYFDRQTQIDSLAGEYMIKSGNSRKARRYLIPRKEMIVIPEGFGAAMTLALDKTGRPRDKSAAFDVFTDVIGVVDIGTYTTDLLQLDRLKPIQRGVETLAHGLTNLHDKVRAFCQSQGVTVDPHEADSVLQRGSFLRQGTWIGITEQRDLWALELARAIEGLIRSKWDGGNAVAAILLTGGGAPYVEGFLAHEFPHIFIVRGDPWAANCEGAFRYLALLQSQGAI